MTLPLVSERTPVRHFEPEDDAMLTDLARQGMTAPEIARAMGRAPTSIRRRVAILGITLVKGSAGPPMKAMAIPKAAPACHCRRCGILFTSVPLPPVGGVCAWCASEKQNHDLRDIKRFQRTR